MGPFSPAGLDWPTRWPYNPAAGKGLSGGSRVKITVNGEPRDVPDGTTVERLLQRLDVPRGPTAVEVNRELVPRSLHGVRVLAEGDAVEIVTLVGGG